MRKIGRVDDNQKQIVDSLRRCGLSVHVLSGVGKGFPDIIVGNNKKNFLFEIKDGEKTKSQKKLTADELEWHAKWRGQVDVIECFDDAIKIIDKK